MSSPAITNTTAKTYEDWRKLVDLHESYNKHVMPAPTKNAWGGVDYGSCLCKVCGIPLNPGDGKANIHMNYDGIQLANAVHAPWVMRWLLERINLRGDAGYDHKWLGLVRTLGRMKNEDLSQLYSETNGPEVAIAIMDRHKNNTWPRTLGYDHLALKADALKTPRTALWIAVNVDKGPSDITRAAASKAPYAAAEYAEQVDDSYHPVTRMGAMKLPGTGVRYLNRYGEDFKLTPKERKRLCRTCEGSYAAAMNDGKPSPECDKLMTKSCVYGLRYITNVVGEPNSGWEATGFNAGAPRLAYMATFDIKPGKMHVYGDRMVSNVLAAYKDLKSRPTMPTADEIVKTKYAHRSRYCAAWILATHTETPEVLKAACRNRAYRWAVNEFRDMLKRVNVTRARHGLAQLVDNMQDTRGV